MEEKIINGFVKLLFNRIEQYSEFILPDAQPNSSNLSEYLNNNRAYGAVECQVQDRKECLIEVFTCGYQTYFFCKGAFSCGSSELFTCSGEQQRSGSQDSFDCTAVFDQHFECSYAQEPFVCDSEMFRCSRASQGEIESFDCKAGDSYDFDCTNSGTLILSAVRCPESLLAVVKLQRDFSVVQIIGLCVTTCFYVFKVTIAACKGVNVVEIGVQIPHPTKVMMASLPILIVTCGLTAAKMAVLLLVDSNAQLSRSLYAPET